VIRLRIAHTADLDGPTRAAAYALLHDVFAPAMTDADWRHCLGGMHALAYEGTTLVGHAALVARHLRHAGRALRAGYVEGVAVRADHRRQGVGAALMAPLERMIGAAYDLGALGASEDGAPFYAARGWVPWPGPTSALTPDGVVPTPEEDGWIYVLGAPADLDPQAELTCDWRDGDAW
jgi:aminoglycoside 2'-N-acetyltransferase I